MIVSMLYWALDLWKKMHLVLSEAFFVCIYHKYESSLDNRS